MKPFRVLVVEDSRIVRKLVSRILSADPQIEVVGGAENGAVALELIPELKPECVTLDVEMPVLGGLATLERIRKRDGALPVIMFSAHTEKGAGATLDALARGASDCVTKPSSMRDLAEASKSIGDTLIPKIKALCTTSRRRAERLARQAQRSVTVFPPPLVKKAPAPLVRKARRVSGSAPVEFIVLGISTGGPNALAAMMPKLPKDLDVPMLIVQHMPSMFTALLAKRLDRECSVGVVEGQEGMPVEKGWCYMAPGGRHMEIKRSATGQARLHLTDAAPESNCRPAVDVLFRSAVKVAGPGLLAVVMTGMGSDGVKGCELIKEQGGYVIAQDEESSVVWGMPGGVTNGDLADAVLPLDQIAGAILRRVRRNPVLVGV